MGFDHKTALKAVKEISVNEDFSGMNPEEREKEIFRRAIVALSS